MDEALYKRLEFNLMHRFCLLLAALALVSCTSAPARSPRTPPEAAESFTEKADASRGQEEWFRLRLLEADGSVRANASASGLRSWKAWSAGHPLREPRGKAVSPLGARVWQEAGPRNIAGRVLSVALDPTDPDVIWAGSAGGGLWRSGDFGQTWRQMGGDRLPSLWISAIAVDPNNPQVLYMGTGETNGNLYAYGGFGGLLKTADGGQTFTRIPLPETAFYRTLVSPADSNLVLTAAKTGLYRSADAGAHFTRTLTGEITDFAQDPKNLSRFAAVRATAAPISSPDSGLFESLDSGVTWHPMGTGLPANPHLWGRAAIAFSPAPSPMVYLALDVHDEQGSVLFRSADDGQTWATQAVNGKKGYSGVRFYGAHLVVPSEFFMAQANGNSILVSRDGGLNWTLPAGDWHVDTHGIAVHPLAGNRMVLATDGGVAVSSGGGASFRRVDLGFPTVQLYTCAIGRDSSTLFGGTQDNYMTVYRGAAGGAWEFSTPPRRGDITGISVNPAHPEEVVAVTSEALGVGFSNDTGRTWTSTRDPALPSGGYLWVSRLTRSPIHPQQVYLAQGAYLDASSDGGRTWTLTRIRQFDNPTVSIAEVAVSPAVDGELWTIWTDGKVLVSEDGGGTWQEHAPSGDSRAGLRISAGPAAGTAYAALSGTTGARLFRTRDHGLTWVDISRDLPQLPLNAVLADPRAAGRLFVATDVGVAFSQDDGATWQDASGALPNAVVLDLCLDPASGRLAAATYGRGLWELKAPPPCQPDAATLCLNNNRFEVKASWATTTSTGAGQAHPLTADTGYFWFFDPANVEAVVKVIDGCGVNQSFWTFAGGLTNVRTVLTVRDTLTGGVKTYTNPQGRAFQPIQDVDSFPACNVLSNATATVEAPPPSTRAVSGSSLLLNEDRFKVDVTWEIPDGTKGTGVPVALTSDTGYFWFFAPGNVEMVIKVLRGCGVNGSYWVFAGGLTNVKTVLKVTDTVTGKVRTYVNPQSTSFQPIQDVDAFAVCR
jgi:photosystem II stability/assembly factor-like uncharacterized protein